MLVIIFQDDIRKAIEHLYFLSSFKKQKPTAPMEPVINCLVESSKKLSQDKIGALIVIRGREIIDRHLSGGTALDGYMSTSLLCSIFHPKTPSHDGAVILDRDRIEKFAVRLPLTHNEDAVKHVGTRHAAALGIAERTDAFVIVISEERGTISVAHNGVLQVVEPTILAQRLLHFFESTKVLPAEIAAKSWFSTNTGTKFASVGLATLLWVLFAFQIDKVTRNLIVPIEFRNIPENLILDEPRPSEVKVSVSGHERNFNFDPGQLAVSLDASNVKEGSQDLVIAGENLNLPNGITAKRITPRTILVKAQPVVTALIPIQPSLIGELPPRLQIEELKTQPTNVKILMPQTKKSQIVGLQTEPINLKNVNRSTTLRVKLLVPPDIRLQDENSKLVKVNIKIREK